MTKKILSIITILGLMVTSYSALAYTSDELNAANDLAAREIIRDRSNDISQYNLDSNVLRQEIALISRRVSGFEENEGCDNTFGDVTATKPNDWVCKNVESLVDNDLISKNELFRPEDSITKSEALIMFIRSIGFDFKIDDVSNWQEEVVTYAVSKGVVENFTDYNTLATRGWIFKIANFSIVVKEEEVEKGIWKGREVKKYSDEAM